MASSFVPELHSSLIDRRVRVTALLRTEARDLTLAELADLLPPRGPTGAQQNRYRGMFLKWLNAGNFTCRGKRLT